MLDIHKEYISVKITLDIYRQPLSFLFSVFNNISTTKGVTKGPLAVNHVWLKGERWKKPSKMNERMIGARTYFIKHLKHLLECLDFILRETVRKTEKEWKELKCHALHGFNIYSFSFLSMLHLAQVTSHTWHLHSQ